MTVSQQRWANVTKITATSWLVARHPEILEQLGFTVEGEISQELRDRYFKNDPRKIYGSFMDRETFLNKYGK